MKTGPRIAIGGAAFAASLPIGFFFSLLFFRGEMHIAEDLTLCPLAAMLLAATLAAWVVGCVIAALVVAIAKARPRGGWVRPLLAGTFICSLPWLALMVKGHSLFIAQDNLILSIAGAATGLAVAFTGSARDA